MFCGECGAECSKNAKFCNKCGNKFLSKQENKNENKESSEKTIIEGRMNRSKLKKIVIVLIVLTSIAIINSIYGRKYIRNAENSFYYKYSHGNNWNYFKGDYPKWYHWHQNLDSYDRGSIILTSLTIIFGGIYIIVGKNSITVTNKRVYGKTIFRKQVDLPLDSISSVGLGMFKKVTVATSSGKINFFGIIERDEVYEEINKLLLKRQDKTHINKIEKDTLKEKVISSADEIKKYKELLDSGAITQKEFDEKKRELLKL